MSQRIPYENKVALDTKPEVPEINKWTDQNINDNKIVVDSHATEIENLQANQVDGILRYDTKALLDLETGVSTSKYEVTDDPDPSLNGQYKWNGSIFEKTELQTLSASDVTDTVTGGSTDVIESGGVYNDGLTKNIKPTFLNVFDLNQYSNNASNIVEYNGQEAIQADITSTFNIYTPYIAISDLGLSIGDDIHSSAWISDRAGNMFLEFSDVNETQIIQISTGDFTGFNVNSLAIPSNTVYVRVIFIINTSAGLDYSYIYKTVLSGQKPNENTISTYKDYSNDISKIDVLESDVISLNNSVSELESGSFTVANLMDVAGDMQDISLWSSGIQEAEGIRVSGTGSLMSSTNKIPLSNQENISLIIDVYNNLLTDGVIEFALFDSGTYAYRDQSITLSPGENRVVLDLTNNPYSAKDYKVYFNQVSTGGALPVDLTFKSLVFSYKSEADTILLNDLYNSFGFSLSYSGVIYAKNASTKADNKEFQEFKSNTEGRLNKETIVLRAYATTNNVSDDPNNGVFAGSQSNINAIQRAIDTVPTDTSYNYEIRCYEDFSATSFIDMSATDSYGREYKAFISLTGKKNIKIVGSGNKKTIISCILPDTGSPVDYKWYQPITLDCKDCSLENLIVIGQNLRYAIHTESQNNIGSNLTLTNVHAIHQGNTGQAAIDWSTWGSYTFGISDSMKITANQCIFTSVNYSGFGGHDQYNEETGVIELNQCFFNTLSTSYGAAISFKLFGNNTSRLRFVINGNNFGNCKELDFGKGANNDEFYANIVGFGNSEFYFTTEHLDNPFPEVADVLTYLINTSGASIVKNSLVDDNGALTTGSVNKICIDAPLNTESFRAVGNTLIKLSDIPIKSGETISTGDYVEAENGELKLSSIYKNAIIISYKGSDYIRF